MRLSLRRGGPRDLAALAACLAVGEQICADLSSQDDPPAEIASACAALTLADKPRLAAFAQQVVGSPGARAAGAGARWRLHRAGL